MSQHLNEQVRPSSGQIESLVRDHHVREAQTVAEDRARVQRQLQGVAALEHRLQPPARTRDAVAKAVTQFRAELRQLVLGAAISRQAELMKAGIDLGTSYSLIARMDGNSGMAQLVPDHAARDDFHTPSVVLIANHGAFVGRIVETLLEENPDLRGHSFLQTTARRPDAALFRRAAAPVVG